MNLPQLTARIGEAVQNQLGDATELSMLVKPISVKNDVIPYTLFMTFDLEQEEIRFEDPVPFQENDVYQYHYFGNNAAAGMQYYMTRDGDSVHYLLKSAFSDLNLLLHKNGLGQGELASILKKMKEKDLMVFGSKQGEGSVVLDKIKGLLGAEIDNNNNVIMDDKKRRGEALLRYLMDYDRKEFVFPLIVPRVVLSRGSESVILPLHEEYVELTKIEQNLVDSGDGTEKLCFVCNEIKPNVSSSLTADFSRSGINKIFGTTTYNYAKALNKKSFDDSYAICPDCYRKMLFGERKVSSDFLGNIAGERTFIIPEGLLDDFEYDDLLVVKKSARDLFFDRGAAQHVDEEVKVAAEDHLEREGCVVHFFINRTSGNSINVLETFADVPTLRLARIQNLFGEYAARFHEHIRAMSLGSIYRMIPVRVNKDGKQLDIGRVLTLYKALFSLSIVESRVLFGYAVEALDRGFRELRKKEVTQFHNLGLVYFHQRNDEDNYFRQIVMRYLCLMHTCKKLGILDRDILNHEGVRTMSLAVEQAEIQKAETFLKEQGFGRSARAMFYTGMLLRCVAEAQVEKKHMSKPVLNKVDFHGMKHSEMIRLYHELVEKLRQYQFMSEFTEGLMQCYHFYNGADIRVNDLSEQENVFYLLSGYSYMPDVARKQLFKHRQLRKGVVS